MTRNELVLKYIKEIVEEEKDKEKLPINLIKENENLKSKIKRVKGQKHLLIIDSDYSDMVIDMLNKKGNVKFLLASKDYKKTYIFVVYKISTEIDIKYIESTLVPYNKYIENIEFIWKRGKLIKNIGFNPWSDKEDNKPCAYDILQQDDETAQKMLTIEEYYMYKKLKKMN